MSPRRALPPALVALVVFAGCGEDARKPDPLTRLHLDAVRALVSSDRLYAISADGSALPAGIDGSELELSYELPGMERCVVRSSLPVSLVRLDRQLFVYYVGGEVVAGPRPDCQYFKLQAVAARATGQLLSVEGPVLLSAPQEDGDGTAYALDEGWRLVRLDRRADRLVPAAVSGDDQVLRFGVSAGGDLAYERGQVSASSRLVLVPATGPATGFDAAGGLSGTWRGADGALRVLRRSGDAVTLFRIDFGAAPALTPLASWVHRDGELLGRPARAGTVPLLVESDRIRAFEDPDAQPSEHALDFIPEGIEGAYGALWLSASERAVRWTPEGGVENLVPPGAYTVRGIVPFAVDGALVLATRKSDGVRVWLRASPGVEPWAATGLPESEVFATVALD